MYSAIEDILDQMHIVKYLKIFNYLTPINRACHIFSQGKKFKQKVKVMMIAMMMTIIMTMMMIPRLR